MQYMQIHGTLYLPAFQFLLKHPSVQQILSLAPSSALSQLQIFAYLCRIIKDVYLFRSLLISLVLEKMEIVWGVMDLQMTLGAQKLFHCTAFNILGYRSG